MTDTQNRFQKTGVIKVIQGSIIAPHNAGLRFVLNVANTAGKLESPLYPLFEKKWPKVKAEVRGSYATRTGTYKLGTIANSLMVQSDTQVISMLCQDDQLKTDATALQKCLKEVCKSALYEHATVHISSLLTELIPELQDLATKELVEKGVSVNFYQEPQA